MRKSVVFMLAAVSVGIASPTHAILTSNMGGNAGIDEPLAREISVSSSQAIEAVSQAVTAIEIGHELSAGNDEINSAVVALKSAEQLIEKAIDTAGTEPLELADPTTIEYPRQLLDAANGIPPAEVMRILEARMRHWPPTERSALEFLLAETRAAQAAVEMIRIGLLEGNADMGRLGLLAFARYQTVTTEFSILWSLVEN